MLVAESGETYLTARGMLRLDGKLVGSTGMVFLRVHLEVLDKASALLNVVVGEVVDGGLVK